ncbi:MAG: pyruvate, water dikinase regulatory protein [Aerococcus sp.]|nr:pyruvate, water dikinase regulatory protein [Aerococcus sp.]
MSENKSHQLTPNMPTKRTLEANKDASSQLTLNYVLISDAAGRLNENYLNSAIAQYPTIHFSIEAYPFAQHTEQLSPILTSAKEKNAAVIGSFVKPELDEYAETFCTKNNMRYLSLMGPIVHSIEEASGIAPLKKPGSKEPLNDRYYNRIRALEFSVANDDGRHPNQFKEADIVLLGISRTSKTPLSIYLAFQGFKVANLPLVPESTLPEEIFQIDKHKIIGLTNDVNVLNKFRKERLRAYGIEFDGKYNNDDRIEKELEYANQVYDQLKCPVINVAARSIEETATLIAMLMGLEFDSMKF